VLDDDEMGDVQHATQRQGRGRGRSSVVGKGPHPLPAIVNRRPCDRRRIQRLTRSKRVRGAGLGGVGTRKDRPGQHAEEETVILAAAAAAAAVGLTEMMEATGRCSSINKILDFGAPVASLLGLVIKATRVRRTTERYNRLYNRRVRGGAGPVPSETAPPPSCELTRSGSWLGQRETRQLALSPHSPNIELSMTGQENANWHAISAWNYKKTSLVVTAVI